MDLKQTRRNPKDLVKPTDPVSTELVEEVLERVVGGLRIRLTDRLQGLNPRFVAS